MRLNRFLLILLALLALAPRAWADSTVPNLPGISSLTNSLAYVAQGGSSDTQMGFDTGAFCLSGSNMTLCSGLTLAGSVNFTGTPIFSALSAGTCSKAVGLDSGNHLVTFACSALTPGGSNTYVQYNSGGSSFGGTSGLTVSSTAITGATFALGSDATGDLYYNSGSGVLARLGVGSSNQVLTVDSGTSLPSWKTPSGGTTITLAAGLGNSLTVPNPGSQTITNGSTLTPQLIEYDISSSCVLDSTCDLTNDASLLVTPIAAGLTITLPAPTVTHGENTGYVGYAYSVTTPSGLIYGCGTPAATLSLSTQAEFVPGSNGGSNWQCIAGGSGGNVSALSSLTTNYLTKATGSNAIANSSIQDTGASVSTNEPFLALSFNGICITSGVLNCGSTGSGFTIALGSSTVTGDLAAARMTTNLGSALGTVLGTTRGATAEYGASGWTSVAPGTATYLWTSNGAGADPSWQAATGGLPTNVTGQHIWFGQNGAVACPLSEVAGVITPAVTSCAAGSSYGVEFQTVQLASGSNYLAYPAGAIQGQPIVFSFQQPSSGAAGTLALASGYMMQGSASSPTLSSTNNVLDKLQCWGDGTAAGSSTTATGVTCNQPLTNYQAVLGVTIPSTGHGFGTQCGGSGQTTCTASITIASGDTLEVYAFACASNCATGTLQNVSTVAVTGGTGTIGSCAEKIRQAASNTAFQVEGWTCSVTGSGTPTITVTWAGTQYYQLVYLLDLQNAGSFDVAGSSAASGTSLSVSANSATTMAGDHCSSFATETGGGNAITAGETLIDSVNASQTIAQYQNGGLAGSTPTGVATSNNATPSVMLMMCVQ